MPTSVQQAADSVTGHGSQVPRHNPKSWSTVEPIFKSSHQHLNISYFSRKIRRLGVPGVPSYVAAGKPWYKWTGTHIQHTTVACRPTGPRPPTYPAGDAQPGDSHDESQSPDGTRKAPLGVPRAQGEHSGENNSQPVVQHCLSDGMMPHPLCSALGLRSWQWVRVPR